MTLTATRSELLANGNDDFLRQVIHDALSFSARLQDIRNQLGEVIGLSGPAYTILIAIDHLTKEGPVGVSRVSEHLHLSGAFITIETNKLVKAGLVRKGADPRDGRRVTLSVTPRAKARLEKLAATQCPVNDALFSGLSRDEFQQFGTLIAKLVEGSDEALALLALRETQRRIRA